MKWVLKDITQETDHPFLNFFTLHYEVDGRKHDYFMASRKKKEELRALHSKETQLPDGVIMLLTMEKEGTTYVALTQEFRPPFNRVFTAIPAGLMEKGEDLFEAAKREAKEEIGVEIDGLSLFIPPSSTSEGMSDEMCAVIRGNIVSLGETDLQGNEDLTFGLFSLKEVREMLDDPTRIFPLPGRIALELLLKSV